MFPFAGAVWMTCAISTGKRRCRTCFSSTIFAIVICHFDFSKSIVHPTDGLQQSPVVSKRGHNTPCLHLFGWALVKPLGQELEKAACALVGGRTKQALTILFDPLLDLPDLTESRFGHCMPMQIVMYIFVCLFRKCNFLLLSAKLRKISHT